MCIRDRPQTVRLSATKLLFNDYYICGMVVACHVLCRRGSCLKPSTLRIMAWHCTTYHCCLHRCFLSRSFFYHGACISRTKNQRGHWLCWMSTSKKSSLMWSTQNLIYSTTYLFTVSSFFSRSIYQSIISKKYQWSLYQLLCESHGNSLLKSLREIPRS